MKITNFSFTLRQVTTKDGYDDNYYVNIDDNGVANVSHPYKHIEHKEQAAILGIIQSGIVKYGLLVNECDKVNRALKLEEYAPKVSVAETSSESAVPQSCALGGEEGMTVPEIVKYAMETEIQDAPFEETETKSDKA